ncbi:MAG: M14 family zinc carboxypeptidase [Robiginitalea sp.]|uniref:M14 family zinc carboxypeptidase n=1 Tax=Robiginitalea sp. TaxID=1902411 RepID=UPI003C76725F
MIGFSEYEQIKVKAIQGRYLPPEPVYDFLKGTLNSNAVEVAGYSVEHREIYALKLGNGPKRVLMWSQMHGNESTTTKALMDLIQKCLLNPPKWLEGVELLLVPVLNPDGARAYTRVNANHIDLNRDAQRLSQPESQVLRSLFDSFAPHYCMNLHDQRTIYGIGTPPRSATLSFLAPAADPGRGFSASRRTAAGLIGLMADSTRAEIGIGRYDDTFNLDCVGDTFQAAGVPTLLVEAGHYPGDYEREFTRFYVYKALCKALEGIASGPDAFSPLSEYQAIPENTTPFVDILVENAHVLLPGIPPGHRLGLQLEEVLQGEAIHFRPKLIDKGALTGVWGHRVLDAAKRRDLEQINGLDFFPLL